MPTPTTLTPTERHRIVDEVLAIGIPSHLTSPLVIPPPRSHRPPPFLALSLTFFALGSTAFAAVGTDFGNSVSSHPPTTRAPRTPNPTPAPTRALAPAPAPAPAPTLTPAPALPLPLAPAHSAALALPLSPAPSPAPRTSPTPRVRPAAPSTTSHPTTPHAPAAPVDDSLDALLDRALGSRESAPPGVITPASLPKIPTQSQVLTALRALENEVHACTEGEEGVLQTRLVVEGATGRVTSALATGDLDASQRTCVVRVLESARFPAFERERFEIAFPYRL